MPCSGLRLHGRIVGAVRGRDISTLSPFAGRAALPASREFVRIKTAEADRWASSLERMVFTRERPA